jgi:pyroglutamyl-peptidase
MILLTGFGPFLGVRTNPSATLVNALRGREILGHRIVGAVLPVSFSRGPARAVALARLLRPRLMVGFGVATGRTSAMVERVAVNRADGRDVDRDQPTTVLPTGGTLRDDTVAPSLAAALDLPLSDDAGQYVCNAWLYHVLAAAPCPASFVHLPSEGLADERVLSGLTAWLEAAGPPVA